jgi:anti-anti-sigma factor
MIETTHLKRCDLIAISGRFDSNTASEMETALRTSMDAGAHRIVLNMEGVEYFGSAAIRVLIVAAKECRRHHGDVLLVRIPERVRQVLDIAGISSLLKTFDDPVVAVGSF